MENQKQIIREKFTKHGKFLTEEEIAFRSGIICNRLIQTQLFRDSICIALYCAFGNEVSIYDLMDECRFGKNIVLPVITGENMRFYPYTGKENLKKGAFGILEPVSLDLVPPANIDLFIVPGVAFDYACNRLGRGKGYYDRYLSDIDKSVIGLCFDFQLVESIPCEPQDKKMTMVITESAIVFPCDK